MSHPDSVGIVAVGTYSPEKFLTSADVAALTGYPEWVVRDKLGIHKKYIGQIGRAHV